MNAIDENESPVTEITDEELLAIISGNQTPTPGQVEFINSVWLDDAHPFSFQLRDIFYGLIPNALKSERATKTHARYSVTDKQLRRIANGRKPTAKQLEYFMEGLQTDNHPFRSQMVDVLGISAEDIDALRMYVLG